MEAAASAAATAAARQDGCILSCSPHVSVWRRRLPSPWGGAPSAGTPGTQQPPSAAGEPLQERSPFSSPLRQSLQRHFSQDDLPGLPSRDAVRKLVSVDSAGSHAAPPSESSQAAQASTGRHSRGPSHSAPHEVDAYS